MLIIQGKSRVSDFFSVLTGFSFKATPWFAGWYRNYHSMMRSS